MRLFSNTDLGFVQTISALAYCNPFRPERIELERQALGKDFDEAKADWNVRVGGESEHPNLIAILVRCREVLEACRAKLDEGAKAEAAEIELFEDLLLFVIYHDHRDDLDLALATGKPTIATVYRAMLKEFEHFAARWQRRAKLISELPHLFAGFVQIRRAFYNIYEFIVGVSQPSIALRAAVWESIFTHDMRRYRQVMFRHLGDYATLVTGASGTGKELVARAIGLSRYVPFDPEAAGKNGSEAEVFFPVSLAAMSPTLVESELFGHVRGAFTGALADRKGWFETCPPVGAVFLDEIGELEPTIQVKLLRTLQSREFSRLGESRVRKFQGKIIAATNRNLADEMHHGRFREDLYYRLCSDIVEVPSLSARIADDPQELHELVDHLIRRIVDTSATKLVAEVEQAIEEQLGKGYPWPGNIRELEQCVRNLLIRKRYVPPQSKQDSTDPFAVLMQQMRRGDVTAEEVVSRYCQLHHQQTGSYEATARTLNLDRRTVKARVVGGSKTLSHCKPAP